MNDNNNNKFTATLVTAETKNAVVALRDEANVSEKELMTLIVNLAIANHKSEILEAATKLNATKDAERAQKKAEAYEALKAKLQAARDAKKKEKEDKPAAAPKAPKPVKAPKTAPATT